MFVRANLPPAPQGIKNPPEPEVVITAYVLPTPPYTVMLAMNASGLTGANQDQTFATEVFMDDFESCKDISNEDLEEIFNNFSCLNATQRCIRLISAQKNRIKAFTQWVKDQFRLGIDPTTLPFPQADTAELLRRANTNQIVVSK